MTTALVAGLVTGLLLPAGPVAHAATAHDPGSEVAVSRDGTHWSDSLAAPLFDPAVRWVPGDVRTALFYVRNRDADAGDLRVTVQRTPRDALIGTGWLTVSARAGQGPLVDVAQGGSQTLVEQAAVAPTSVVPVHVTATLDPAAPDGTQVLATDLDLHVTLTRSVPGSGAPAGTPAGTPGAAPTGALPDTGSDLQPWVVPLALLMLASGTVLVARHRHVRSSAPTASTASTDPGDPT